MWEAVHGETPCDTGIFLPQHTMTKHFQDDVSKSACMYFDPHLWTQSLMDGWKQMTLCQYSMYVAWGARYAYSNTVNIWWTWSGMMLGCLQVVMLHVEVYIRTCGDDYMLGCIHAGMFTCWRVYTCGDVYMLGYCVYTYFLLLSRSGSHPYILSFIYDFLLY